MNVDEYVKTYPMEMDDGTVIDYQIFSWEPYGCPDSYGQMNSLEYKDRHNGAYKWVRDGERFLTKEFRRLYTENNTTAALLKDGRPELVEWLYHGSQGGIWSQWYYDGRKHATAHVEKMIAFYSKKKKS
jgi:hypothetical protein